MCGICGIVGADPRGIEPAVRRMMRALVHRGPDDDGYEEFPFGTGSAPAAGGFGFRRLAIMDLSPRGHQPMVDPATGDTLAFNGEIYNFAALRTRLEGEGHVFRSTGDTEVLLRALSAWGERALDALDGMFAFAYYHAAGRRVLLARDPLGIKPLYVARAPGRLLFASEVRSLLASGLVAGDLDMAGIAGFLAYGAPQDPLTVHRDIRSLPAGGCEWIDAESVAAGRARPRRYWRFPEIGPAAPEPVVLDRVAAELSASVNRQCVADVPLAVFLSGGIDSAALAALAVPAIGHVRTFAVGYEAAGSVDETAAAAETARALGTQHFQTIVDDDWVMLQMHAWFKAADRPSIDGLNTFIISGAIRDRDITVALSGLGADELFGGYPSFRRVPRLRRWLATIAWLPAGWRRAAVQRLFWRLPAGQRAKLADLLACGSDPLALAATSRRLFDDDTLRTLGVDARTLGLTPQFLPPEACEAFLPPTGDTFATVSRAELSLYMGNTLLRDSDVNSMAHSLELRVPFLGQDLVDYVARLPGPVRAPPGTAPKHLLRRVMQEQLPAGVFTRPKSGFSLPFAAWMAGPLRDQCATAIDALADCPAFDGRTIRDRWAGLMARPDQVHWSRPLSLVVLGNYLAAARRHQNG
jgi:asparagine synthase (glutamine-hydrolysing)